MKFENKFKTSCRLKRPKDYVKFSSPRSILSELLFYIRNWFWPQQEVAYVTFVTYVTYVTYDWFLNGQFPSCFSMFLSYRQFKVCSV